MALYSLSTKSISRKQGRSAVAAAAYRSGVCMVDERTGVEHDYTRRRGVEHVEIMALDGIAIADSAALWNAAEAAEKRKDARVAREVLVALPDELDEGQRTELAQAITRDLVERYGVAAELAIHAPDRGGDQRNHHAHILITTRRWNHDGPGQKSQLEMSDTQLKKAGLPKSADELFAMRERWAIMQNAALERAGVEARVDHRNLDAQGIARVPQIHQGGYATEMIRAGTPERSERASLNLEIITTNSERDRLYEQAQREVRQSAKERVSAESRVRRLYDVEAQVRREHYAAVGEMASLMPPNPARPVGIPDDPALASCIEDELALALGSLARDAADMARLAVEEQQEWEAWTSQPGVCSATGRIIDEVRMMHDLEQSWRQSQQIEAIERAEAAQQRAAEERRAAEREAGRLQPEQPSIPAKEPGKAPQQGEQFDPWAEEDRLIQERFEALEQAKKARHQRSEGSAQAPRRDASDWKPSPGSDGPGLG